MKNRTLLGLALALFLWRADDVEACDCRALPPPSASVLSEDEVIFVGTVVAVTERNEISSSTVADGSTEGMVRFLDTRIRFRVVRAWKGVATESFTISQQLGNCQFNFLPGSTYVVFASKSVYEHPATDICHRTTSLDKATKIFEALGTASYVPPVHP